MSDPESQQWQRLSEHLDRVLELSQPECARYLAALEDSDFEIAVLLRRLLAAREQADFAEFLSESPRLIPDALAEATLIGRRVGPYVIEAEIGSGGMGSVWRASREDGRFEARVAIKFVHLSCLGTGGEQRFKLEGRVLARLNHASIARLIDAGVLDGTHPYIVMEYVDGEPIDRYCQSRTLGMEARIRLFLDVLAAVSHAHSQLVVHRDLKPSNVLVTGGGAVKLLDFGVAKFLDQAGDSPELTHSSARALTPHYAAPELLLGHPVTTATDVYALGLMLYVLLAEAHPLSQGGGSRAELIQTLLTREIPRPSLVATGTARRRALAGDLDNILAKALKKGPSERYLSVEAFADDLERFLAHQPVHARRDTAAYRIARFVRRHRGAVLSGVLVALGLIGVSVFAVLQMLAARTQRDFAVYQAKLANAQSDLTAFVVADTLGGVSRDVMRERLDRARKFVTSKFRRDPLLAGRLLIDVSGRYVDIGESKTAAEVIQEAEAIGRRMGDSEYIAELACIRTQDLVIAGNLPAARVQLDQGLENMRRLRDVPPSLTDECASGGAFVAQADGDFVRAVSLLSDAVKALERAGLKGEARYTSASNDLARAYVLAGDFHRAWDVESQNMAMVRDAGRADTSAYLAMTSVSCTSLRDGGQPRRALELLESALAEARQATPDFETPYFLVGCRALNQIAMGRPQEAATDLLHTTELAEQAGQLYHLGVYRAAAVTMALDRDDLPAADSAWSRLAPEEEKARAAGDRGADAVRLILTHARLDLAHHRAADALSRLETATARVASRHQPSNPDAREVELLRVQAFMAGNDYAQAKTHAQNAVTFARASAVDGNSSAWVGEALVWRARCEVALGTTTAAQQSAREALPHLEANLDPAHPLIAAARNILTDIPASNSDIRSR